MKIFKGTPGPWVRESTGRGIGPVSTDDDQSYGMVIPVAYVDFGESDEIQNSNARLIAAAPELLEALQFTIHDIGYWLSTQKPELKEKIESAINKALGERSHAKDWG